MATLEELNSLNKKKFKEAGKYTKELRPVENRIRYYTDIVKRFPSSSTEFKDAAIKLKEQKVIEKDLTSKRDAAFDESQKALKSSKNLTEKKKLNEKITKEKENKKKTEALGGDTTESNKKITKFEEQIRLTGEEKVATPIPAGTFTPVDRSTTTPKVDTVLPPTKPAIAPKSAGTTGTTGTKGAGSVGNTGGNSKPPADVKAPPTQQDFLAKYGVQLALINSNPSLKALLKNAMDGNWNAEKWKLEFANSAFATNNTADWQLSETERLTAPATYAARWNRMRDTLARLAVKAGLAISPEQLGVELKTDGSSVSRGDGTVTQWWMNQKSNQMSDEAITAHLAAVGKMNLALPGGQAGGDVMNLKAYAGQMGLGNLALPPSGDPSAMGNDWFSASAISNLLGKTTLETQKAYILQQAKGMFSSFAPALDSGQTVQNIAAPYINTLANLLEIPTDQIDISSSTGYGKMVRDALMGTDPANQKPMALYDFEKQIKGRSEWGKTNNARDTIMGGVNDLLKSFGKVS